MHAKNWWWWWLWSSDSLCQQLAVIEGNQTQRKQHSSMQDPCVRILISNSDSIIEILHDQSLRMLNELITGGNHFELFHQQSSSPSAHAKPQRPTINQLAHKETDFHYYLLINCLINVQFGPVVSGSHLLADQLFCPNIIVLAACGSSHGTVTPRILHDWSKANGSTKNTQDHSSGCNEKWKIFLKQNSICSARAKQSRTKMMNWMETDDQREHTFIDSQPEKTQMSRELWLSSLHSVLNFKIFFQQKKITFQLKLMNPARISRATLQWSSFASAQLVGFWSKLIIHYKVRGMNEWTDCALIKLQTWWPYGPGEPGPN